jgi:hypothetical protein
MILDRHDSKLAYQSADGLPIEPSSIIESLSIAGSADQQPPRRCHLPMPVNQRLQTAINLTVRCLH